MVKSLCGTLSELQGQLLENMVFLALRTKGALFSDIFGQDIILLPQPR
jgi:hypothetical protein